MEFSCVSLDYVLFAKPNLRVRTGIYKVNRGIHGFVILERCRKDLNRWPGYSHAAKQYHTNWTRSNHFSAERSSSPVLKAFY